eukprot:c3386_g1_i1 orf=38-223(-)
MPSSSFTSHPASTSATSLPFRGPALTLLHADLQAPKQPQTSRGHTPIAPYHVALTLHISIG